MKKILSLSILFIALCACNKQERFVKSLEGTYTGGEWDRYWDYPKPTGDTIKYDTTYIRSVVVKKISKDSIRIVADFAWKYDADTIFDHALFLDGTDFKYNGGNVGFFLGDSIIIQFSWGISEYNRGREWRNLFHGKK